MRLWCWYCHKPVTNEIPKTTLFRATATCPECEEKLPDVEMLQTRILELEAERDNLFAQLQATRTEYAALVEAADDCVEFISGGYPGDLLRLKRLRDAVKAVKNEHHNIHR